MAARGRRKHASPFVPLALGAAPTVRKPRFGRGVNLERGPNWRVHGTRSLREDASPLVQLTQEWALSPAAQREIPPTSAPGQGRQVSGCRANPPARVVRCAKEGVSFRQGRRAVFRRKWARVSRFRKAALPADFPGIRAGLDGLASRPELERERRKRNRRAPQAGRPTPSSQPNPNGEELTLSERAGRGRSRRMKNITFSS